MIYVNFMYPLLEKKARQSLFAGKFQLSEYVKILVGDIRNRLQ